MDRRRFLSLLASAAAGMVLDPERLLWVPGAKTIVIPSVQVCEPISIRYVRAYDVICDQFPTKLDCVFVAMPHVNRLGFLSSLEA